MSNITVKQAQESDIPIIEDILFDAVDFLYSIGQPLWERRWVTWQGLSEDFEISDFYIAYICGNPVGCMALVDYDPAFWPDIQKGTSLFIHKLAVKRCGAKQGVSKALIDFAKKQAIDLNINEVRLDCHQFREKLRAVYEREGFVCVGEKCMWEKYHTAFYVWRAKDIMYIRPLTAENLPEYADVIRRSFATVAKDFGLTRENCPGHTGFITNERLESKITDGYYPYGCFIGAQIIGFASLTDMDNGIYEMNAVSVLPEYRHFGYGKNLVNFCQERVKEFGGCKIIIGVSDENTVLKDWYAANGFINAGTEKFEHLPFMVRHMEWEA